MDSTVMELRLKQWLPLFEEQAKSGLNKQDWCEQNGIKRSVFFKWQRLCRSYLLTKKQEQIAVKEDQEPIFFELSRSENGCQTLTSAASAASERIFSSSITVCRNDFSVRLDGEVDEANLTRVLRAIAHAD